ncbi:MAG TPA: hypothetical protein VFQ61_07955 [Polyangiaceae bacterium]|nr:hypothetical protein [Polyangiaceae bacterium]
MLGLRIVRHAAGELPAPSAACRLRAGASSSTTTKTLKAVPPEKPGEGEVFVAEPSTQGSCWYEARCEGARTVRARCEQERCECWVLTGTERHEYSFELRGGCRDIRGVLQARCGVTLSQPARER